MTGLSLMSGNIGQLDFLVMLERWSDKIFIEYA